MPKASSIGLALSTHLSTTGFTDLRLTGSCNNQVLSHAFETFFADSLFLASINAIERPFRPDTVKDLDNVWRRQNDQILPTSRKLAKPNALMFFHIPLYVQSVGPLPDIWR